MAFNYDRVFVVVDDKGEVKGVFKSKAFALEILPQEKARHPQELTKHGDWKYGKVSAWKILERKVRDSAGIPDLTV